MRHFPSTDFEPIAPYVLEAAAACWLDLLSNGVTVIVGRTAARVAPSRFRTTCGGLNTRDTGKTDAELDAIKKKRDEYQAVFDTH